MRELNKGDKPSDEILAVIKSAAEDVAKGFKG